MDRFLKLLNNEIKEKLTPEDIVEIVMELNYQGLTDFLCNNFLDKNTILQPFKVAAQFSNFWENYGDKISGFDFILSQNHKR